MKWFPAADSRRSLRSPHKVVRQWTFTVGFIALLFVPLISLAAPKTSYAERGSHNVLQLVGERCHDLENIDHDFSDLNGDQTKTTDGRVTGYSSRCSGEENEDSAPGWEQNLQRYLGCGDLFYTHDFQDDPNDNTITRTRWYTSIGAYKSCWLAAKSLQETMTDTTNNGPCHDMKKGSDNWNDCQKSQENLHWAIGCDDKMFMPTGDDHYDIKPKAAEDCAERIKNIGNLSIIVIGPDGKRQKSEPIKSESVKASNSIGVTNGADEAELGCDASSNPLTWVICPVINDLLVPAIAATDDFITGQLAIDTDSLFCSVGSSNNDSCKAYYTAWSSFRNIALGLLIIVGLIVVISQALGMEILDAYTIRKMLPRILVAAVGITLSWTLMNFAVSLSNDLGYGIRNLIVAPFRDLSTSINLDFSNSSILNAFFGGGVAVAAIPIWTVAGGLGVLLSYVATAGLAVLIAVMVLVLRQVAIIMLILLAPVALIAYVMPNTQRVFRLWWESFSRALLMFPMIVGFIAAGRVFAAISLNGTETDAGADAAFRGIIGFVAYFAPYFMIPLTFRLSGGMMSGLGNFVNQRAQGGFSALSGYRGNQRQSRVARARAKGLYREEFGKFKRPFAKNADGTAKTSSVGKMLNMPNFYTLNADEMVPWKLGTTTMGGLKKKPGVPGFRRYGQSLESRIKRAGRDQTVQAAQDLDIGYKSGRLMAGRFEYFTKGMDAADHQHLAENYGQFDEAGNLVGYRAPDTYKERMEVADIFSRSSNVEAREAGNELKATAAEFEKYRGNPETDRADGRLLGLLSSAKAGRLEMHDVADNHNALLAQGDQESATRETTMLMDALTAKRTSAARGHGMWFDKQGRAHSSYEDPFSAKAGASLMRISSQEIAGSKSEDLDALRDTILVHGSEYEMMRDPDDGQIKHKLDAKGNRIRKDTSTEEGRLAVERAKAVQARFKTLAQYNYGDSDVGVKVKDIWARLGRDPSELEWGGSGDERHRTEGERHDDHGGGEEERH